MYSIMVVEDSKPIVRDIISKIQSIRPDIKENCGYIRWRQRLRHAKEAKA